MRGDSKQIVYQLADQLREQVHIYLVYGDHADEGALAEIKNGLPMLSPRGLILVHDVDPCRKWTKAPKRIPILFMTHLPIRLKTTDIFG